MLSYVDTLMCIGCDDLEEAHVVLRRFGDVMDEGIPDEEENGARNRA